MNLLRLLPACAALTLAACATAPVPVPPPAVAVAPEPVQAPAPVEPPVAVVAAPPPAQPVAQPAETTPLAAPVDPLRPEVRIDLDDATAHTDLWRRARQGFAMPDLDSDLVRKWEQYYSAKPEYMQRMLERGGRYLFHIVDDLERRGMPTDLALLPFIESAFNPQAMSTAKASGMWQFVPGTGRDYDLKQNIFRDDRRDVLASTRAALDYLKTLHDMFDDWHLALAAYNWGQGSVKRAIANNQRAGQPGTYDRLRMPDETRNYVPKLQAIKNIVARPEAFGLTLPPLQNHPYFLAVPIDRDIDVDLAARLAGLPLDEFKQLNPQMNKPVILAAGTPQVLLPYDAANAFVRAVNRHKGPLASWTAWVAPKTVRPAEAARQVGMSEAALREVNRIPPRMLVKAGSTLLVPRNGQRSQDVATHVADNAMLALAPDLPPLRKVSFKAGKRGTTVAAVARQYKVSAAQVAQWNGVAANGHFKAGQAVVVMVPAKRSVMARKAVRSNVRTVASTGGKRVVRPGPPARRAR
ncbi:transglycosylase SLT domain-containing protein [Ideonella sp. A 288]|uniref:transglycosylase SLT domain-containing protein n=1 Tax=Ideonella sp. A 288 TaxID=1962181 RepID=UPI001F36F18E|nr:transglycosylase SLT domain-containing protein [Ideonella sp. A 288]